MTRRNFKRSVRIEIIKRASSIRGDGQPACEWCAAIGVPLEIHHKRMDAMEVDKSEPLTAADGVLICRPCHGPETANDRVTLAKVLAVEERHLGATQAPANRLQGRGFPSRPNISKITGRPKVPKLPMPGRRI